MSDVQFLALLGWICLANSIENKMFVNFLAFIFFAASLILRFVV